MVLPTDLLIFIHIDESQTRCIHITVLNSSTKGFSRYTSGLRKRDGEVSESALAPRAFQQKVIGAKA